MKKRVVLLFLSVILISNSAVKGVNSSLNLFKFSRPLMGTLVKFTLCAEDEEKATQAAEAAFAEIERLENLLSSWNPQSEISQINKAGANKWTQVSPETLEVIAKSLQLSKESYGAFDITIGALNRIWRMHETPRVPTIQEIKATLPLVDYTQIQLEMRRTSSVMLKRRGMELDLGGIAKGYILEKAYKILLRKGIDNGLIDGGGDIYCWGLKPDKSKWEIGVIDPLSISTYLAVLRVSNKAVFTSGDYERKFVHNGKTYHHLLDPRTGYPAAQCHGVTVIGDNISQVNGLSSTIFILGPRKALQLLKKHPGVEAIIVTMEGETFVSPGFKTKYPDALKVNAYQIR